MGFFKDFKEDFSQAVNDLLPESESKKGTKDSVLPEEDFDDDQIINTLDDDLFQVDGDLEDDFSWLEDDEMVKLETEDALNLSKEKNIEESLSDDIEDIAEDNIEEDDIIADMNTLDADLDDIDDFDELAQLDSLDDLDDLDDLKDVEDLFEEGEIIMEDYEVEDMLSEDTNEFIAEVDDIIDESSKDSSLKGEKFAVDEVTIIGKDTKITGSICSNGSIDIQGTIVGDIECLGKLSVSGNVKGNSIASEIYVNATRLEGSITSEGCIKVGVGTVIIGDVTATSGVIAGAIKGQIDVNGAVVLDSTAIVKGNINAKSVQINNGAVVDGYCSLSYAAVDIDNVFEVEK